MLKLSIRAKCLCIALTPMSCVLLTLAVGRYAAIDNTQSIAVGVLLGVAAALGSGFVFAEHLRTRLQQLREAVTLVGTGMPITPLNQSEDDLGKLGRSLVEMSHQLLQQRSELMHASSQLEAVLRATKEVSILGEDLKGRIIVCNPGAERLLGLRQSEMLGRNLSEIVHPPDRMQSRAASVAALVTAREQASHGHPYEHENVYVRKDGVALQVQLSVAPLRNVEARPVGYLHVASDITHRSVLEAELRQKNEQFKAEAERSAASNAESTDRQKRLRESALGPLSKMRASLQLLKTRLDNQVDKEMLDGCCSLAELALHAIQEGRPPAKSSDPSSANDGPDFFFVPQTEAVGSASNFVAWNNEPPAIPSGTKSFGRRERVLIVDDFEPTRALMQAYLKDLDCELEFATNGEEALDKLRNRNYRVVLMDIEMPLMSGHEAARRIRSWEREKSRPAVPLVAVTAYSQFESGQEAESPWTSSLQKPLSKGQLLGVLGAYLPAKTVKPALNPSPLPLAI